MKYKIKGNNSEEFVDLEDKDCLLITAIDNLTRAILNGR